MYETFDGRGNFHGLHHRLFIAVTVPSANLIHKLPAKHIFFKTFIISTVTEQ